MRAAQYEFPATGRDPDQSRTKKKPTQTERVLRMLMENDEVCGNFGFYRARIPRFSVSIDRLRKQGYIISKRLCDIDAHRHHNRAWLYRLEATPTPPSR